MPRATDYLSATALFKKTAASLDALEKGETDTIIILKNNTPKAVLMSMDNYKAMQEEIEDLRLAALAVVRLETFDEKKAVPHSRIMEIYRSAVKQKAGF